MNNSVRLIAAAVLSLAAGQAMAEGDSIDVRVTGQFIPPACVPAVSGGAVFDFGSIKAASLAQDDYTVLGEKVLNFTVKCDSPMKVAFKTVDGRAGTAVNPVGKQIYNVVTTAGDRSFLGLGSFEGKNIGGYKMIIYTGNGFPFSLDGRSGEFAGLQSADNGQTWKQSGYWNNMYFSPVPDFLSSVGIRGTGQPQAFTTLSGNIRVKAAINKGSELNLTKVIPLDGQATIQMVYL